MLLPRKEDASHRAWLYQVLEEIYSNAYLSSLLAFKGGTCAAMRGFLDRFSVDLDFDLIGDENEISNVKKELEKIFMRLELGIKDASRNYPQYFLKYSALANQRNTLKIDISTGAPKNNRYEKVRLTDVDRIADCQTVETMFANKLVALKNRHEKKRRIAGRDVYDVYCFFLRGFDYSAEVIEEIRGVSIQKFFEELVEFVEKEITLTVIDQDLNLLLPYETFRKIRLRLKKEVLRMLKEELVRLKTEE